MFHYIKGKVRRNQSDCFILTEMFGVQVAYAGGQSEGEFFLYPYLDEGKKSVFYFAFDTLEQKQNFEQMLKVSGVGPKTAFQIAQIPIWELAEAIENLDTKLFQSIPWIGPKLAKKIILELKGNFQLSQASSIDVNQKLFKAVVKSLKNLGYDGQNVKAILSQYQWDLDQADLAEVVKWVISQL